MLSSASRSRVFSPTPHSFFSSRRSRKSISPLAGDLHQPVRLARIRRHLGQVLVRGDADRQAEAGLGLHAGLQGPGHFQGGAQQAAGACEIQEGLVDGDLLEQRGGALQDGHHLFGDLGVALHAHRQEHAPGAAALGLGDGHRRPHSEAPGFVGAGGHHPARAGTGADDDRLPFQGRVVDLLHGGVEGVQVHMKDHSFHRGLRLPILSRPGGTVKEDQVLRSILSRTVCRDSRRRCSLRTSRVGGSDRYSSTMSSS
jgi:hypothetical protein